jgi:hypothetical protein
MSYLQLDLVLTGKTRPGHLSCSWRYGRRQHMGRGPHMQRSPYPPACPFPGDEKTIDWMSSPWMMSLPRLLCSVLQKRKTKPSLVTRESKNDATWSAAMVVGSFLLPDKPRAFGKWNKNVILHGFVKMNFYYQLTNLDSFVQIWINKFGLRSLTVFAAQYNTGLWSLIVFVIDSPVICKLWLKYLWSDYAFQNATHYGHLASYIVYKAIS